MWIAVILAVATGIACGLVNGVLISYGKLPPFIATLAMLSVGRGLSLVISQGSPIAFPDSVSRARRHARRLAAGAGPRDDRRWG